MANGHGTRTGPPGMMDAVVRVLIWSGVAASIAGPLLAIFVVVYGTAFLPFGFGREFRVEELQRVVVAMRAWFGGIVSGGATRGLLADANRLRDLTAYKGEATTVARTLEVIVVRFADGVGEPAASTKARPRTGYRNVGLDITAAGRSAVLIIADAPVVWNIKANAPSQRARIAFEGVAPLDVAGAHPGLLAGFRIESFGAVNTTRPLDALDRSTRNSSGLRRYCKAIGLWTDHFGLRAFDTAATFIENPTSIHVNDGGVAHDGRDLGGPSPYASCSNRIR
jgi:hypothetical protein